MLAIILSILKIAGMILLTVLGLILVLLLAVLLVPIRYRAEGEFYGTVKGSAGVSWLLHILSLSVSYDGKPEICVRIFGFRVGKKDGDGKKRETGKKKKSGRKKLRMLRDGGSSKDGEADGGESKNADAKSAEAVDAKAENAEVKKADVKKTEAKGADAENAEAKNAEPSSSASASGAALDNEKPQTDISQTKGVSSDPPQANKRSFRLQSPFRLLKKVLSKIRDSFLKIRRAFSKIDGSFRKMRETILELPDRWESIRAKKDEFFAFINKEENRETFRLIIRQVRKLLKHVLPGRFRGRIKFGFDDPFTTGQVLTYISPFYALYAGRLEVIPVFEEKVLEGSIKLKGRIRIGTVLAIGIRVFLDQNFRTLLKQFTKN